MAEKEQKKENPQQRKRFKDMTKEEKKKLRQQMRENKKKISKSKVERAIVPGNARELSNMTKLVTSQNVLNIIVSYQLPAVQQMWLGVWGKMFTQDWSSPSSVPNSYGLTYMIDAFIQMQALTVQSMTAQTLNIVQLPYWMQVILNILRPTDVPFKVSKLKYSWVDGFPIVDTPLVPILLAGIAYNWLFGIPDSNFSGYNQPMIPMTWTGTSDTANLMSAIGLIQNVAKDTKLVNVGNIQAGSSDPSAFARSYPYMGIGAGLSSAVFGSCELETTFVRSWMASQFSVYSASDTRVSRSLRIKSGDSNFLCYLPFISGCRIKDYKDPGPLVYKFIDFNEIYYYMWKWFAFSYGKVDQLTTGVSDLLVQSLNFSAQSFRIILRQAILNLFTDQAGVQFMAPKQRSGMADNVFVPYLVSSNTYPFSVFGSMLFPQALAENLRALCTRVLGVGTKNTKIIHVPVLGAWNLDSWDEFPTLALPLTFPETDTNLIFSTLAEDGISLVDGANLSVTGNYVNLNSPYYGQCVKYWNQYVQALGVPVSPIVGEGPGVCLLNMTRYIATNTQDITNRDPYNLLTNHRESNKIKKVKSEKVLPKEDLKKLVEKEKMKKKVVGDHANPPGGVEQNYTVSVSSIFEITAPIQQAFNYLILPTIRPDPEDTQYPQTQTGWQIAYFEPYQCVYQTETTQGTTRASDINVVAQGMVNPPGTDQNKDDFIDAFQVLSQAGKGVDWLSMLSGVINTGVQIATNFI